jgi:hypothetical protein
MPRGPSHRLGRPGFFDLVPRRAALVFFAAVFFLFAPVNFLLSSSFEPRRPLAAVLWLGVLSGAIAVSWAGTFTIARSFAIGIAAFTAAIVLLSGPFSESVLGTPPVAVSVQGLATVGTVVLGYALFIVFISGQGRVTVRLMTEMALAQRIHATLVPAIEYADERLEVDGVSFASSEMGGDLIDMVARGGATDLILADVSGHGVKAGVVMGMFKAALRMALREDRELTRVAHDLNEVLEGTTSTEMYATAALLRIDRSGRKLGCVLAGHSPVLLHRRGESAPRRIGEGGFPVGLMGGSEYQMTGEPLESGDLVASWTDGLDETFDDAGVELGREAIERAIVAHADRPLAEIRRAVFELVRSHGPQRDDRSLLLLRIG